METYVYLPKILSVEFLRKRFEFKRGEPFADFRDIMVSLPAQTIVKGKHVTVIICLHKRFGCKQIGEDSQGISACNRR